MLREVAIKIYDDWAHSCENTIFSMLEKNKDASILDLGSGDGIFTKKVAKKIGSKKISAIEGLKIKIKDIDVKISNLNHKFPYPSNSFDVVMSTYSIEHLYNTPLFISETFRVLKKGGYTIVATDNLSSWANIISLILGFQAFSTAYLIKGKTVGNPFAIRSEGLVTDGAAPDPNFSKEWRETGEFGHNKVLSFRGLVDSYKTLGFRIEKVKGVGYLPFKGVLSKTFSLIDSRHSHLLVMKARKV